MKFFSPFFLEIPVFFRIRTNNIKIESKRYLPFRYSVSLVSFLSNFLYPEISTNKIIHIWKNESVTYLLETCLVC